MLLNCAIKLLRQGEEFTFFTFQGQDLGISFLPSETSTGGVSADNHKGHPFGCRFRWARLKDLKMGRYVAMNISMQL